MKNFESVKRKIQKLQAMIDRGESLEIKNMYEWHAAKFREELDNMKKDLVDAFVMEHNLTSDDNSDRQDEDFTFTKEDLERFERIMMMQQNLGRERYYKMIGI